MENTDEVDTAKRQEEVRNSREGEDNTIQDEEHLTRLMYRLMGGDGKFQITMVLLAVISLFFGASTLNLLSYAAPDPVSECRSAPFSDVFETCTEEKACRLMASGDGRISFQNENWTQKYKMYCDNQNKRDLLKNLFPLMNLILGVIEFLLVDLGGRKFAFLLIFLITSIGSAFMFFGDSFFLKNLGLSIASVNSSIFYSLYPIALNEWAAQNSKVYSYSIILMFAAFPLGNIAFNLIVQLNNDTDFLSLLTIFSLVLATLPPTLLSIESPLFLLKKKKFTYMKKCMIAIAKFNNKETPLEEFDQFQEMLSEKLIKNIDKGDEIAKVNAEKKEASLLKNRHFLFQIFALSIVGGYTQVLLYAMYMHLQFMGGNSIEVNGIIFAIVAFIANMVVFPFAPRLKRKRSSIICQVVLVGCSILLYPVSLLNDGDANSKKIVITLLTMIAGAVLYISFVPFYYMMAEIFPVEARGLANSLTYVGYSLLGVATPFLCSLATDRGLHFLVGCSLLGLVSLPLTFCLKETMPN